MSPRTHEKKIAIQNTGKKLPSSTKKENYHQEQRKKTATQSTEREIHHSEMRKKITIQNREKTAIQSRKRKPPFRTERENHHPKHRKLPMRAEKENHHQEQLEKTTIQTSERKSRPQTVNRHPDHRKTTIQDTEGKPSSRAQRESHPKQRVKTAIQTTENHHPEQTVKTATQTIVKITIQSKLPSRPQRENHHTSRSDSENCHPDNNENHHPEQTERKKTAILTTDRKPP